MKIVVLDGTTLNPGDLSWELLHALGEVTIYDKTEASQVIEHIGDAPIVLTNKTLLTQEILLKCPALRYIGVLATGYNVVDLAAAKQQNIVVCNVPAYGTATVAQFTTALMLELCNQVSLHSQDVKQGGWSRQTNFCYWLTPMIELASKKLGIIGFGRIGKAFATIAQAMGMSILVYSEHADKSLESETLTFVDLDTLLTNADIISLHCALTPKTQAIINATTINKMKKEVLILNASRGPLINEQDLADALNSSRVAGAAVDVLSVEPPPMDNPLLSAKNCIITPHIAWASKEARTRVLEISVANINAFLNGKPQNRVDTL